ncbi:MAG: DUF2794 domain-containing protein [Hyphomonadaceae bacterium]
MAKICGRIFFDRRELDQLLRVYGRQVAAGEWRDYAMDALSDRALFSVYRRHSEAPLYQIEKRPENARRQGAWSVLGSDGRILKRGRELDGVLRFLEPKHLSIVSN